MPRTLFDKIWDSHLVGERADVRYLLYIDRHVLHELHAHHAFTALEKQGRPIHRPDLTFAVQDHTVATKPGRDDDTNPTGTAFLRAMREGTRKNGIRLFDIDDPEQGISHVVAPELGIVLPGATHAVPDSHASTVGGVGALAFGRGSVVEYAGSAVRAMPIEQRMTLCNLNIEMGGRSGFVAPDDATFSWLAGRPYLPKGAMWDRALETWRSLATDDDAEFDREVTLDCGTLEPQITWGTDPSQVVGISGRVPETGAMDPSRRAAAEGAFAYMGLNPGTPLAGLPVNRVFIGSCTHSRLPGPDGGAARVRGPRGGGA